MLYMWKMYLMKMMGNIHAQHTGIWKLHWKMRSISIALALRPDPLRESLKSLSYVRVVGWNLCFRKFLIGSFWCNECPIVISNRIYARIKGLTEFVCFINLILMKFSQWLCKFYHAKKCVGWWMWCFCRKKTRKNRSFMELNVTVTFVQLYSVYAI